MSVSLNFSALEQFCKEYSTSLFAPAILGIPSLEYMEVLPGVKDKLELTHMTLGTLVQGWQKSFDPKNDSVVVAPRTLETKRGKVDIQIYPGELYQTWLAKAMRPGQNNDDLPFEQFILDHIIQKLKEELELQGLFNGVETVTPPATSAANLFDGFLKIVADEITATNLTPVVTGAITSSNAYDAVLAVYRAQSAAMQMMETYCYLSLDVYQKYIDDYQATVGAVVYNESFDQMYVPGSNKRCMIVPCPGLIGSQRIMISPRGNMVVGMDLVSDLERITVEQDHRSLDFMIDFNIGAQLGHLGLITVNDQA